MTLLVTNVFLECFRSYERLELSLDPELTVFVGPNAAGKTNAIEAVQTLATGTSFRRPAWSDIVRWGSDRAAGRLEAAGGGRELTVQMEISDTGRRSIRVNGKRKRSATDLVGLLPVVTFTPDDLRLVKDAAEKRRSAIDSVGDQLSKAYLKARTEYERALRQRNAALKSVSSSGREIEVWDEALVRFGAPLSDSRERLFNRIRDVMSETYASIAPGEDLTAEYVPSWEREGFVRGENEGTREIMSRALEGKKSAEFARGASLIGPHRDDVAFYIGGRDARVFASQGQQRTISLAWKLAEVGVIGDVCGQRPLLLLDDVMSELDETRRAALATVVGGVAQTIITTTNLGYFDDDLIGRAKVVRLQ